MGFLGFAAFVGIWGLLAWHGKKRQWSGLTRHLLGAGLGLAAFGLIAPQPAAVDHPEKRVDSAIQEAPQAKASTDAAKAQTANDASSDGSLKDATLGLSLDQYTANFNAIGAGLKPAIRAYLGDISEGQVNDVATIKIDDRRMLTVTLRKGTKIIKEVTLIGQGDGTPGSGVYVFLAAVAAAQAAVPEAERAEIGPAMARLLQRLKPNEDSVNEVVGGKKVWMLSSDVTGFMFGISPAVKAG